jgi:aminotransferase
MVASGSSPSFQVLTFTEVFCDKGSNSEGEDAMGERFINERLARLGHSEIRSMTQACTRMKGLNMAQGVCDTPVPAVVIEAAERAMEAGENVYSRFDGLFELRQAIADKLARDNGVKVDVDREITVSAGATGAFHCACLALFNPNDEVILFEPYYQYHISALLAVEAVPVIVAMRPPAWTLSTGDVERAVTPRTKAIIVNSPGNPSGRIFSKEELRDLAAIARCHDLLVLTDEIYEYFLYDGHTHVSMAALPDMAERTITIGGYSKTFSVTGWRIGYAIAAEQWTQAIGAMNDLLYVCAPTPLQAGVAAGIRELPTSFYRELAKDYQGKRDRFCRALSKAGLTPSIPNGAYYVLADASRLPGRTGKERAMYVLEKIGLAGVPGEAFFSGPDGHAFIRFSYAKTDADIDEACRRLAQLA